MTSNSYVSPINDFPKKLQIGWKYYNSIKKKAMENKFSWSGFIISISIAFFIVLITAYSLSLLHASYKNANVSHIINRNIYSLEIYESKSTERYIQSNIIDLSKTNNLIDRIIA